MESRSYVNNFASSNTVESTKNTVQPSTETSNDFYTKHSNSFGSNSELASYSLITPVHIKKYKNIFTKLVENNLTYNMVITGTIAAGKSTKCDLFRELMIIVDRELAHSCFYPEYLIHSNIGNIMLQKLHDGSISNITFQHYIMDEFYNILRKRPLRNINLFERCPDDATFIFCKGIEEEQLTPLYKRAAKIASEFNIPTFIESIPPYHFRRIENYNSNIFDEMLDIVERDVDEMIRTGSTLMHRIFGLVVTPEESLLRLRIRNRDAESDCDIGFMKKCYENYNELYEYLEKHRAGV